MSKKAFTKNQTEELLKNENVFACSERYIQYSKNFKIQAVTLYNQGLPPREIFEQAGFSFDIIGKDDPKECLKRWNRIYRRKGEKGFSAEYAGKPRGRPKKPENLSDSDKIKYLEAENAYLKAENDFLAKLRKQRLNYGRARSSESSDL